MMVFKYRRRRRVVVPIGNLTVFATISAVAIAVLFKLIEWPTSSRPSDSIPPPQSLDDEHPPGHPIPYHLLRVLMMTFFYYQTSTAASLTQSRMQFVNTIWNATH
ncbi:hypothetical protein QE152_g6385 [Popillia japonica]|uniref:Uncharacterized protein n=1 Tax=Popillia japonica TaxID=7064 RepID=A0AAW1MIY2_POPJA